MGAGSKYLLIKEGYVQRAHFSRFVAYDCKSEVSDDVPIARLLRPKSALYCFGLRHLISSVFALQWGSLRAKQYEIERQSRVSPATYLYALQIMHVEAIRASFVQKLAILKSCALTDFFGSNSCHDR